MSEPIDLDAAEAQVFVTEVRIVPAGAELGDRDDADFGLKVSWRGQFAGRSGGGWSVDHRGVSLSRAGNWAWPSRFQRWQYRWETREEAVAAALAAVDGVQVNGRTRAEWAAHWASRAEPTANPCAATATPATSPSPPASSSARMAADVAPR